MQLVKKQDVYFILNDKRLIVIIFIFSFFFKTTGLFINDIPLKGLYILNVDE